MSGNSSWIVGLFSSHLYLLCFVLFYLSSLFPFSDSIGSCYEIGIYTTKHLYWLLMGASLQYVSHKLHLSPPNYYYHVGNIVQTLQRASSFCHWCLFSWQSVTKLFQRCSITQFLPSTDTKINKINNIFTKKTEMFTLVMWYFFFFLHKDTLGTVLTAVTCSL